MINDYDDDTHFCLKCHATILGLDNYVTHRKSGCHKPEVENPKSPLPSQLLPPDESFGLKADDFFSSLELQSSSKKPAVVPSTSAGKGGILTRSKTTAVIQASLKDQLEAGPSKSGKNVWIGGHQLKELGHGDNETKLIKAVDNLERRKEEPSQIEVYEDSDEDSEEYYFEDDEEESDDDAPPSNYTGGKWKPSSPVQWGSSSTTSDWNQFPPPSHTGGKWKPCPASTSTTPSTKPKKSIAKWTQLQAQPIKVVPNQFLRKSSGTVQYWCNPCNRRLASKIVYERHLKSELHFKRTLQGDFDEVLQLPKRQTNKTSNPIFGTTQPIKKRQRKKLYIRCDVCQSKVNRNHMGKHLISHYHCRKGQLGTSTAQKMVLEHIQDIVLQSPFQCQLCEFYTNTHEYFLQHWLSQMHFTSDLSVPGQYLCTFCNFECSDSTRMFEHLNSHEHLDVVAVINRSVPIVIRKYRPIYCLTCQDKFQLNIELKHHCQELGHDSSNIAQVPESTFCTECARSFSSKVALQRHNKYHHNKRYYICSACNLKFNDVAEAKLHRTSQDHQNNLKGTTTQKTCEYCQQLQPNFITYKQHLQNKHSNLLPKCPNCNACFTLPQELTVHLRSKSCKFQESTATILTYTCSKCQYSTDSLSEFCFHEALHSEPIVSNGLAQYLCCFCEKYFQKSTLKAHLRVHTQDKPFVCGECQASFTRKSTFLEHARRKHGTEGTNTSTEHGPSFLCSTCGASFAKKSILQQHMQVHTGKKCKCPMEDCSFSARRTSELDQHYLTHFEEANYECTQCPYRGKTKLQLKRHSTIHSDEKKYECEYCEYSTRISGHLKRHLRLHTGDKPFKCPYCKYTCNNKENLRKHILQTNKHLGRSVYECTFCDVTIYVTNSSEEFKQHLLGEHAAVFTDERETCDFVAGVHRAPSSAPSHDDLEQLSAPSDPILPVFVVTKNERIGDGDVWSLVADSDDSSNDVVLFREHFP